MDNLEINEAAENGKEIESVVKITRKQFEDGGYEETRVEEVEGGYIICKTKRFKKNGEWSFEDSKSVSTINPLEEKSSLAEKLENVIKGMM